MALAPGVRLGPYEIHSAIGAGGMGEVWRARDTTLGRDVALKILPDHLALDPDRLARFKREAQILASLNHPNIATIHGFQETDGVQALVLELVEGPTLADRIAQGATPIDEALPIAKQIAQALEAAHEQGVVHRDLKPANIKVTEDGTVKVLDFGLAKAMDPAGAALQSGPGDLSQSPTITTPAATLAGVIMGTAAYMAPEQAKGRAADKRSDVWAFGCVLYEMLAGRRAFESEDVSDTLAAVLRGEPNWSLLPANVPFAVRAILERCLRRDRKERLADISIAHFLLTEQVTFLPPVPAETSPRAGSSRPTAGYVAAALGGAALVAMAAGGMWLTMRPAPPRASRLQITPPPSAEPARSGNARWRSVAITRDAARVVYAGSSTLFVRALDQLESTPLAGLGPGPSGPFLSSDGQWVGFSNNTSPRSMKKVAITGGPPVTLVPSLDGNFLGATWSEQGTIVYATSNGETGLQRISSDGSEPIVLTTPDRARGEADHVLPEFLPGGQTILFTILPVEGGPDQARIAVLDLRNGSQTTLVRGGTDARYVRSGDSDAGYLVYGTAGTLRAVTFDAQAVRVSGTPVPVVSGVSTGDGGAVSVSVAEDGTVVYVPDNSLEAAPAPNEPKTLVWVNRQGQETPLPAPVREYANPRLSPDGTKLALDARDDDGDIWIWDFGSQDMRRFTFDASQEAAPVWTADGRRVVFASVRDGRRRLFWQAADGSGVPERLGDIELVGGGTGALQAKSVSRDGRWLIFRVNQASQVILGEGQASTDLGLLDLRSEEPPRLLVHTAADESDGSVSPDGRWLAYHSDESGQVEVYVRPFPGVDAGRWQVSVDGGSRPVWSHDGRELFYSKGIGSGVQQLMVVTVQAAPNFSYGRPQLLFQGRYAGGGGWAFDVSPDGRRFLMMKPVTEAPSASPPAPISLIVLQNWVEELRTLVPSR